MNTKQLFCALQCQPVTSKYFDGIFAKDTLSDIVAPPQLLVCNTAHSSESGDHWVLFHFIGSHARFYDPLGLDFSAYGNDFIDFVNMWSTSYEICNVRTQPSNSSLCGVYCLFFAYFSCKGRSIHTIVKKMKSAQFVKQFVKNMFSICPRYPCRFLQSCVRK